MKSIWALSEELQKHGTPFVMITLVSVRGSSPAEPGAKVIVTSEGLQFGTVGGGKVEARAIVHAKELLTKPSVAPELIVWNLQRDIGMTCGGEVTYLFETHRRNVWSIAIFGAGHVGQAVVRVLEPLACQLTCTDHRAEWYEKLPSQGHLIRRHLAEPALSVEAFPADTFFAVMTQGHATDVPILEAIARYHPETPYVGVIGSDVKAIKIRAELLKRGVAPEFVKKLHCPMGLPVGTNATEEMAISIAAELLQVRDQLRKS